MTAKEVAKELGAQLAHTLLAMAILAPVVFAPGAWRILGGAVSGYLAGFVREDAQHRTPDQTPEGWGWFANGFPEQWVEIADMPKNPYADFLDYVDHLHSQCVATNEARRD